MDVTTLHSTRFFFRATMHSSILAAQPEVCSASVSTTDKVT